MSEILTSTIADRYKRISERLQIAITAAGRPVDSVKMLVVTKGQPVEKIVEAYNAGARLFGENYPEETARKLNALTAYTDLQIHMIGHLQSRKARVVAESFCYMHSLDRVSIAQKLNQELESTGRTLPVLLEMNVSGEESKQGFNAWDPQQWGNLLNEIGQIAACKSLEIHGLMTMPPLSAEAEAVRPYFQKLSKLREYLTFQMPSIDWSELSMGTSSDFETAVQEGATFIRVGTAIMGPRTYKKLSI